MNLLDESPFPLPKRSSVSAQIDIDSLIKEEGADDLAPVIKAIYEQETSSGRNVKTSVDGARGPMQVMPATYQRVMGEPDTGDPVQQARAGIREIKRLSEKFGADPAKIAVGYFSGEGNVNLGDGPPYRRNLKDSNGKDVSSYMTDVLEKLQKTGEPKPSVRPMTWDEVKATPEYQNADFDTREAMRNLYFKKVVIPQLKTEEIAPARKLFDEETAPGIIESLTSMMPKARPGEMPHATGAEGMRTTAGDVIDVPVVDVPRPSTQEQQAGGAESLPSVSVGDPTYVQQPGEEPKKSDFSRGLESGITALVKGTPAQANLFLASGQLSNYETLARAYDEVDKGQDPRKLGLSQSYLIEALRYQKMTPEERQATKKLISDRLAQSEEFAVETVKKFIEYQSEMQKIRGDVPDLQQAVKSPSDFMRWLSFTWPSVMVSNVPFVLTALSSLGVGAAGRALFEKAIENAAISSAEKIALKNSLKNLPAQAATGATVAAAGAQGALGMGGEAASDAIVGSSFYGIPGLGRPSAIEQQTTPEITKRVMEEVQKVGPVAAALAIPYGLVETKLGVIPEVLKALTGMRAKDAAEELSKITTRWAAAKYAGKIAAKTALGEATEEVVQKGLEDLAKFLTGRGDEILTEKNIWDYAENFLGGALAGGTIGGVTGAVGAAGVKKENQITGLAEQMVKPAEQKPAATPEAQKSPLSEKAEELRREAARLRGEPIPAEEVLGPVFPEQTVQPTEQVAPPQAAQPTEEAVPTQAARPPIQEPRIPQTIADEWKSRIDEGAWPQTLTGVMGEQEAAPQIQPAPQVQPAPQAQFAPQAQPAPQVPPAPQVRPAPQQAAAQPAPAAPEPSMETLAQGFERRIQEGGWPPTPEEVWQAEESRGRIQPQQPQPQQVQPQQAPQQLGIPGIGSKEEAVQAAKLEKEELEKQIKRFEEEGGLLSRAVARVVARGVGAERAKRIKVARADQVDQQGRLFSSVPEGVEAQYDDTTDTLTIFADRIRPVVSRTGKVLMTAEERAAWVAWHELFHRGKAVRESEGYKADIAELGRNRFIRDLATRIMEERAAGDARAAVAMTQAIEEAGAELEAAIRTGRTDAIRMRYGLEVPDQFKPGIIAAIKRFANRIKHYIKKVTGRDVSDISDAEAFGLIRAISGRSTGEVRKPAEGTKYSTLLKNWVENVGDVQERFPEVTIARSLPREYGFAGVSTNAPVTLHRGTVEHIRERHGTEGIDSNIIGALPELLAMQPRAILDPRNENGVPVKNFNEAKRVSVILPAISPEGHPLLVVLEKGNLRNGNGPVNKVIQVATLYGKHASAAHVLDEAYNGRLLFIPKKEVERLRGMLKGGGKNSRTVSVQTESGRETLTISPQDITDTRRRAAAYSVAPPKLTDKQRAVSLIDVVYGDQDLRQNVRVTNSDDEKTGLKAIGRFLEENYRKTFGGPLKSFDDEAVNFIAEILEAEAIHAMDDPDNAIDWYRKNLETAMQMAAKVYPSIGTPDGRAMFAFILAITSPGLSVADNVRTAFEVYGYYEQNRKLPQDKSYIVMYPGAKPVVRAREMVNSFARANAIIRHYGVDGFVQRMLEVQPVSITKQAFGMKNIKELVDAELPVAVIFGSKVGAGFFPNLMGRYEFLTIDQWLMRTIGRLTGDILLPEKEVVDYEDVYGRSPLRDAPRSAAQRDFIRRVMSNLLGRMRKRGYDLEVADLQALLWYPEKIYYQRLGARTDRKLLTDYGTEVTRYAEKRGLVRREEQDRGEGYPDSGLEPELGSHSYSVAPKQREDTGIYAEVVPGEGQLKERLTALPKRALKLISESVARSIVPRVLNDMGIPFRIEHSVGGFMNESSPNFIVHLPKSSIDDAVEVAKVLGYVFDQKAMIAYDESVTEGNGVTSFVTITKDGGISPAEAEELFGRMVDRVSSAVNSPIGYSVKDGHLIIGNFTNASDEAFLSAIRSALASEDQEYDVGVKRFRSDWIEPGSAEAYLEGTRYGNQVVEGTGAGREGVRGSRRADADRLRAYAQKRLEGWVAQFERPDGGRGRATEASAGEETSAVYGEPREHSVEVVGHHFSGERRQFLNGAYYGRNNRGAEWERVKSDPELSHRIYFYFDTGSGIHPESVVGSQEHTVRLRNLYDADADPLNLVSKDRNAFERAVIEAGFDGYLTREFGRSGAAVLIGRKHTSVPVQSRVKFSTSIPWWAYSPLHKAVRDLKVNSAPADQWENIINGLKNKGVKEDEIAWTGVREVIKLAKEEKRKLTKEDVLRAIDGAEYIAEKQAAYTGKRSGWVSRNAFVAYGPAGTGYVVVKKDSVFVWGTNRRLIEYNLEDYWPREHLIDRAVNEATQISMGYDDRKKYTSFESIDSVPFIKFTDYKNSKEYISEAGVLAFDARQANPGENKYFVPYAHRMFGGSEKNRIFHLRYDIRKGQDGQPVFFIQEIQSDWAQHYRKGQSHHKLRKQLDDLIERSVKDDSELLQAEIEKTRQELDRLKSYQYTPSGPFIQETKSWVSLALKSAINQAIVRGVRKIAWTNGMQQTDRYDLRRVVDKISVSSIGMVLASHKHSTVLSGFLENNNTMIKVSQGPAGYAHETVGVYDLFGDNLGKKIVAAAEEARNKNDSVEISVDDALGGAGMLEFYDKIVPMVAEDVLKKLGGDRVKQVFTYYDGEESTQLGFDITDDMMQKFMSRTVPLFSTSGEDQWIETEIFGEQPDYGDGLDEGDISNIIVEYPGDIVPGVYKDTKKLRDKRSSTTEARVGAALLAFAKNRKLFDYKIVKSSDLNKILTQASGGKITATKSPVLRAAREMFAYQEASPTLSLNGVASFQPHSKWDIEVKLTDEQIRKLSAERGEPPDSIPRTAQATVYFDDKTAVANMIGLTQNVTDGALIYQAIMKWAAATNRRFVGDPFGLSDRALIRRAEATLNSILREGKTDHVGLHANQYDAGLRIYRDDVEHTVGSMAIWLRDVMSLYNEPAFDEALARVKVDGETQRAEPTTSVNPYIVAAGNRTISRVAITEALLRLDQAGKLADSVNIEDEKERTNAVTKLIRESTLNLAPKPFYSVAPQMTTEGHSGLIDLVFKKAGFELLAKHITSPIWDKLHAVGRMETVEHPLLEKVAHGLIADYGLPEPYLDAKIVKRAHINRRLRESKNLLDHLANLTKEESRIAYLWMSEKPDTELERRLMARLPEDSRQHLLKMKELVDELGREAVALGLLSEESYNRNRMAYLHRTYARHLMDKGSTLMKSFKRSAAIRAENFRGRGLRDDVKDDALIKYTDEVNKGDLFVRFERRDETGRLRSVEYVPLQAAQTGVHPPGHQAEGIWEARFFDKKNEVGMWRDLTKEERERLGEIEEVKYAFAKTVIAAVRDVETARFLAWVNREYAKDPKEVDNIVPASEGFVTTKTYGRDEWVIVPSTYVQGTKIHKYGALAGRALPGVIWNDIRTAMAVPEGELSQLWDSTLRFWKKSKTALSPSVHMNNVMSNFIMADVADVRVRDIIGALNVIIKAKKGDPQAVALMNRYEDSGAEYGSFVAADINEEFISPILKQIEGSLNESDISKISVMQLVWMSLKGNMDATKSLLSRGRLPFDTLVSLYQQEDSVFRLAKFMREIDAGKSDIEAGKAARDAFLNYDINAPWVQAARRSALPFIAFSYRAIPLMIETAFKKPWKIAKYWTIASVLNSLAYSLLGADGDEERERRLMPEELSGRVFGIFPRMVRLPWNDRHGSPVFLDVRRWVPGGSVFDVQSSQAIIPVPDWLSVGGPLSLMAEFFVNKSQFTGKPIIDENDTPLERAIKFGDWFFKAMMPNLPLPGPGYVIPMAETGQFQTWSWTAIESALRGKLDPFGREVSLGQALASSVGVKIKSYPPDEMRLRAVQEFKAYKERTEEEIRGLARQLARRGITQEEFDRRVQVRVDRLREEAKKTAEKVRP
jgi:hypothetical protein